MHFKDKWRQKHLDRFLQSPHYRGRLFLGDRIGCCSSKHRIPDRTLRFMWFSELCFSVRWMIIESV